MEELNRREAAAGLWIGGSALVLAACSRTEKDGEDNDQEQEVTANEDLMREHGVLRRILVLYREIAPQIAASPASVDGRALAEAATLFRDFGEQYHEEMLEERYIFPRVRSAGGNGATLIDTLAAQHKRGREITDYVLDRTRAGRIGAADAQPLSRAMLSFARMYEAHAAREDTLIFPAFKAALGPKNYSEMGEQFEQIERKMFGRDGFEFANGRVGQLEQTLGIANLGSFTAPPPPGVEQPLSRDA